MYWCGGQALGASLCRDHVLSTYSVTRRDYPDDAPLKTRLEERDGVRPVVTVEDQIERGEEAEGVLAGSQQLIRNDAIPERVEGRGAVDSTPPVRR